MTDSVSEVDVADPEDVKALITSGSSDILVHFGQEKFLHRYEEFEEHLAEWKQQYPKLASADMRYEGQIVLEMQGEGGPATVGTEGAEKASVKTPAPGLPKPTVEATPVALKPAAAKIAGGKQPVVKAAAVNSAAVKPPMPKLAVANAAVSKPRTPKATVANVATAKPVVVKPDLSNANMPKAAAPQPVVLNDVVPKPAVAKPVAAPKLVATKMNHPVAKKVAAKSVVAKAKPGSGMSAANAKIFAKLAAEHRAELAKEHKGAAGNVAKNARAGAKGGVTP
jgi:hypothetical protein